MPSTLPDLDNANVGTNRRIDIDSAVEYQLVFHGFCFAAISRIGTRRKHMNASIAIQVLPTVDSKEELIRIVDEAIAYIKSFGLHTEVGPFETTVEGDYDTLMEIIKGCSRICIDAGAPDVMTYVKINLDPTSLLTMDLKTAKHREVTEE